MWILDGPKRAGKLGENWTGSAWRAHRMFGRFMTWWRSLFRRLPAGAKACEQCGRPAAVFEYRAGEGGSGVERHLCEACARRTLWVPCPPQQSADEPPAGGAEVPVEVERVLFSF